MKTEKSVNASSFLDSFKTSLLNLWNWTQQTPHQTFDALSYCHQQETKFLEKQKAHQLQMEKQKLQMEKQKKIEPKKLKAHRIIVEKNQQNRRNPLFIQIAQPNYPVHPFRFFNPSFSNFPFSQQEVPRPVTESISRGKKRMLTDKEETPLVKRIKLWEDF
jgi:hypothetical protein